MNLFQEVQRKVMEKKAKESETAPVENEDVSTHTKLIQIYVIPHVVYIKHCLNVYNAIKTFYSLMNTLKLGSL